MAVRSDPDAPADLRSRQRSHEGAVRAQETTPDYPIRPKDVQHNDEKTRIGETRLVKPNQTVILDSGATASKFRRRGLSVICLMNAMGRVITDRGINPGTARELERQGVPVTAA